MKLTDRERKVLLVGVTLNLMAGAPNWSRASEVTYFALQMYASSMRARLSVTVDQDVVAAAEAAVASGRASSVSAWVAEAMAQRARQESLREALAEIRAELGPATDDETAWARSVLGR